MCGAAWCKPSIFVLVNRASDVASRRRARRADAPILSDAGTIAPTLARMSPATPMSTDCDSSSLTVCSADWGAASRASSWRRRRRPRSRSRNKLQLQQQVQRVEARPCLYPVDPATAGPAVKLLALGSSPRAQRALVGLGLGPGPNAGPVKTPYAFWGVKTD